jgi:hypothetical protein
LPSWDDVLVIGSDLPGVEAGTWFGAAALNVGGKKLCRRRTDPDALIADHDAGRSPTG